MVFCSAGRLTDDIAAAADFTLTTRNQLVPADNEVKP